MATVPPSEPDLKPTRPPVLRSSLVALLLLVGVAVVYGPRLSAAISGQPAASAQLTYVTDLDYWQRTPRETQVVANAHFDLDADLTSVPLELGQWHGEEVPETNQEVMILLDPEQYVQRLYHNDQGQYIWLSMIGGRSSKPFHAPDICYDADGWQYNLSSTPVPLEDGGDVYGLWLEARKRFPGDDADTEQIVFYFYLFPTAAREHKDGIVLFKLTSGRYGSLEDTLAIQGDFVRQLFRAAKPVGG